jgi:inosine/xanthosine triphosphate pyrophosphatase family protein
MHDMVRWLKPEDFLALLAGKQDRTVVRRHTVVYYDGKRSKVFAKDFPGVIVDEPKGHAASSFEQIMVSAGQTRTNAELADAGELTIPSEDSVWHEFAKWYQLQRRLGKA